MKQIIAMGGGGFSMEPENPLLDTYVLKQSGKERPKICFVPTASGDAEGYIERFYAFFREMTCEPTHLTLLRDQPADLERFVLEQDIIYVGGGNTKNLMALWRAWGLDHIFRKAWEKGIILAGISAGSLCWFEEGVSDSLPDRLSTVTCVGILPGSNCVHYDGEVNRRPSYHAMLKNGEIQAGLAADDGAAFHFIGTELHKVVSSRPDAKGYAVGFEGDGVVEKVLETTYLGSLVE